MNDVNYWNKICSTAGIFFLTTFVSTAQTVLHTKSEGVQLMVKQLSGDTAFSSLRSHTKLFTPAIPSNAIIPPNYYAQHLGFVCKKELALEKFTKVPLRLRLGSLQQCNYLEGKK